MWWKGDKYEQSEDKSSKLLHKVSTEPRGLSPVSRTPMDTPMLNMKVVRSAACLQNGIAYIPNAVRSMENPGREEWLSWNLGFICDPVLEGQIFFKVDRRITEKNSDLSFLNQPFSFFSA